MRPTRVHEKFGGFHISAHGCAKNTPDFTIPNKDTPKSCPILDPNLRRGLFRGVCNTPLHGYVHNSSSFIFPHPDAPKNAPDFTIPNRDTPKTHPVLHLNHRRRTFQGVCFCAPTRVYEKFGGFHISTHVPTQNPPDFRPKPLARNISGRMLLRPYTGTPKKLPGFIFPHTGTPKTHLFSPFPIGIDPKPARF